MATSAYTQALGKKYSLGIGKVGRLMKAAREDLKIEIKAGAHMSDDQFALVDEWVGKHLNNAGAAAVRVIEPAPLPTTRDQWAGYIGAASQIADNALKALCVRIYEYKRTCDTVQGGSTFSADVMEWANISKSYVSKFAAIGENQTVSTSKLLGNSAEVLYQLTKITQEDLRAKIDSGEVTKVTTVAEARKITGTKTRNPKTAAPAQKEQPIDDGDIVEPNDPDAEEVVFDGSGGVKPADDVSAGRSSKHEEVDAIIERIEEDIKRLHEIFDSTFPFQHLAHIGGKLPSQIRFAVEKALKPYVE